MGTTTVKTPAALAAQAADAVRALNHATLGTDRYGWEEPADAYSVLGALDAMAGGLPQSLDQVWYHLSSLNARGHVTSDQGTVASDVAEAGAAIEEAKEAAQALAEALARAHAATSTLGYRD